MQQPLQPLEKDFLERVLQGRSLGSGPYSNPRRRRREIAENRDNIAQDTRIASGFFRQSQPPRVTKEAAWLSFRSSRPKTSSISPEDSSAALPQTPNDEIPTAESAEDSTASGKPTEDAGAYVQKEDPTEVPTNAPIIHITSSDADNPGADNPDADNPVRRVSHPSQGIRIPWQDDVVRLMDKICDEAASVEESWGALLGLARGGNLLALRSNDGARHLLLNKVFRVWSTGEASGLALTPSAVLRRFENLNLAVRPRQRRNAILATMHGALISLRDDALQDPPLLQFLRREIVVLWDGLLAAYSNHPAKITAKEKKQYFDAMIRRSQKNMPELGALAIAAYLILDVENWSDGNLECYEEPFMLYARDMVAKGSLQSSSSDFWKPISRASPEAATTLEGLIKPRIAQPLQKPSEAANQPSADFSRSHAMSAEQPEPSQDLHQAACGSRADLRPVPSPSDSQVQPPRKPRRSGELADRDPPKDPHPSTAEGQPVAKWPRRQWTPNSQQAFEEGLIKRIGRANTRKEASWLDALWKEATDISSKEDASLIITAGVYTHFLAGYMAARRPGKAIELWNHALQSKTQPTVQMWDALLRGFGAMRDANGVQEIWGMLIVASRPDAHLWASRIQGLANSGNWRAGAQAFQEMLTDWVDAAQRSRGSKKKPLEASDLPSVGSFDNVPKPTLEALNGLIPALARVRQHGEIARLLQGARRIGVMPDVYTFNAILKGALRDGDQSLVDKLFQQMKKEGVQPDLATFTMLMDSLFKDTLAIDAESSSSEVVDAAKLKERHDAAGQLLDTLHEYGLEANTWTFGAIINGVLKTSQDRSFLTHADLSRERAEGVPRGSITAAYAILDYMTKRRVPLSSSIYTALATAHFQQRPEPDLEAIDALWQRSKKNQNVPLDVIFYDRLIEGYARHERLRDMKLVLAQAARKSRSPGWVALNAALTALGKAKDWTAAEDLVFNVKREEHNQDVVRGRMGKAWFVRTCQQLGYDTTGLVRKGDEDE